MRAHMDKVLGNIAASVGSLDTAPRLLRGTGSDNVHLLLVCTAERGLCGPFNTAIVRLARERATSLMADGKEVKFFCVGRKGYDQLRRLYGKQIIEMVDLRAARTLQFRARRDDRGKGHRPFRQFRVRCLHAVLLPFPLGDRADSDRAADHPAGVRLQGDGALDGGVYEFEPEAEDILRDLLPRNVAVQIFRALLENSASFYGAQMSAMDNATRNAGDMIRRQTLFYNRTRQAMITKEFDRDYFRR